MHDFETEGRQPSPTALDDEADAPVFTRVRPAATRTASPAASPSARPSTSPSASVAGGVPPAATASATGWLASAAPVEPQPPLTGPLLTGPPAEVRRSPYPLRTSSPYHLYLPPVLTISTHHLNLSPCPQQVIQYLALALSR